MNTSNLNHRIYTDIAPIISALKHGRKRIAKLRYIKLCKKFNLNKGESAAIVDTIQNICRIQNITMT